MSAYINWKYFPELPATALRLVFKSNCKRELHYLWKGNFYTNPFLSNVKFENVSDMFCKFSSPSDILDLNNVVLSTAVSEVEQTQPQH